MLKKILDFAMTIWTWIVVAIVTVIVTLCISFAALVLGPFDPQRKWPHAIGWGWARAIQLASPLWKLHILGRERINPSQSYVIISNHSSLADIICLYRLNTQFKWLAKTSLFRIPFFGWSMACMKYIRLERGKPSSIRKSYETAKNWLRQGMSILIFPEGTRSPDGSLGVFKNGAFKLAIDTQRPILPIVLRGSRQIVRKGDFKISPKTTTVMRVLQPIDTSCYGPEDFEALKSKARRLIEDELHQDTASSRPT